MRDKPARNSGIGDIAGTTERQEVRRFESAGMKNLVLELITKENRSGPRYCWLMKM
jgi:hypothetical protein